MSEPDAQIIIAVPGPWRGPERVAAELEHGRAGLTLVGERLMDRRTAFARLQWLADGPDPVEAFRQANADACLSDADLRQLARRTSTSYARHSRPSFEAASQMLRAGMALLDAGGLAVLVESANLAHSAAHWRELAARHDPADLYRAFVRLVLEPPGGHSCGMHNFGLPDVSVRDAAGSDQPTGRLLDSFNAYLLLETPDLANGHRFSPDEWSPWYCLRWQADPFHPAVDAADESGPHPLYNPFGVWELVPEPN
jgi:hypothetical protein